MATADDHPHGKEDVSRGSSKQDWMQQAGIHILGEWKPRTITRKRREVV